MAVSCLVYLKMVGAFALLKCMFLEGVPASGWPAEDESCEMGPFQAGSTVLSSADSLLEVSSGLAEWKTVAGRSSSKAHGCLLRLVDRQVLGEQGGHCLHAAIQLFNRQLRSLLCCFRANMMCLNTYCELCPLLVPLALAQSSAGFEQRTRSAHNMVFASASRTRCHGMQGLSPGSFRPLQPLRSK